MTKKKIDWTTIEEEIIYGIVTEEGTRHYPTLQEQSDKYNVSLGTLKNKSSKNKWMMQRDSHKQKVTIKVLQKKGQIPETVEKHDDIAAEYDAETIVLSDEKFEKTGEHLRKLIEDKIRIHIANPAMVKEYNLKMLGDALQSAQNVVKTAQGEITEHIKIEAENNVKVETCFDRVDRLLQFIDEGNDQNGDQ